VKLSLKDFRSLTSALVIDPVPENRCAITGVSTDSRTMKEGNIFFAIRGENFDGHKFVADVINKKVSVVVVDSEWKRSNEGFFTKPSVPVVVVPDTVKAIGELARLYRRKFSLPIIAVGGSNGKTTTKELTTAVLQKKYTVLSTEGNLNNHIGIPHTLFRLTSKHQIAVLELGTNHFGEMKYLCDIAEPTHGLLTNIGREHLEFFGNVEGVAQEETELYRFLAKKGFVFVNGDDKYLRKASGRMRNICRYGFQRPAEIRGGRVSLNEKCQANFHLRLDKKKEQYKVQLSVAGLRSVTNALAAIAVGVKFHVPVGKIINAVETFTAPSKRMEIIERKGLMIINDTYNANPDSMRMAFETLEALKTEGRKIVVLADMLELGDHAVEEHQQVGMDVSKADIHYLFTYGPLSLNIRPTSDRIGYQHFDTKPDLVAKLTNLLQPGDIILVKGSRGMKMEDIVSTLGT
jgi:UDP-N-acetylmuramoyl-tripeptide--D-alanyl-D-alanine ligase